MPVSYKNWDSLQMKKSSTWRELHCVSFALKSFAHLLSGCFVKWFTDSQAASLIVDSGSMKEHLHLLAVDIFHIRPKKTISKSTGQLRIAIFMRSTLIGSPFSRLFSLFTKTTRFPDFVQSSLILVL